MDRSERHLQRRAAEGDVEAEAEVLGQRLRRDDVSRDRLELIAELGYEPACLALSYRPPAGFYAWLEGLGRRWGRWVCARVALYLAQLQLPEPRTLGDELTVSAPRLEPEESASLLQAGLTPGEPVRIGRSADLELSLPSSSSVSRLHCQLNLRHDGTVWLEDLGSANGTWLGDQRLPPHVPTPLAPGSCFFAGRLPLLLDRGGNEDRGLAARQASSLIALRAWAARPSGVAARAVHDAAAALVAAGVEPHNDDRRVLAGRLALRAAIDAVLADPLRPGGYLPRAADEPDSWRRAVAATLGPELLEEPLAPIPTGCDPPAGVVSLPVSDELGWLGEALGVEVLGLLARGRGKRTLLARRGAEEFVLTWVATTPSSAQRAALEEGYRRFSERLTLAEGALRQPGLARHAGRGVLLDGSHVFLSELVRGRSLPAWLAAEPRSPSECAGLVRQLARSLAALCDAGLTPPRLAPRDVLVEQPGGHPVIVGLVEDLWQEEQAELLEDAERVLAQPPDPIRWAVCPPEVFSAEASTPGRRAVYQLGGLLHFLLGGELPFAPRATAGDQLMQRVHPSSREPRALEGLPPGLAEVVRAALAFEPGARPAGPAELAAALAPFCERSAPLESLDEHELAGWAERGDAAAEALLLARRHERGALSGERLRLAADLGYAPARRALGQPEDPAELTLEELMGRLVPWGRRPLVEAASELLRLLLPGLGRAADMEALWVQVVAARNPRDVYAAATLVPGRPVVIGRGGQADLRLHDPSVSRQHCRLELSPEGVLRLADMGSSYGTRCDGEAISGASEVSEGALLKLGSTWLKVERSLPQPASVLEPVCLECLRVGERWLSSPSPELAREAARLRFEVPPGGTIKSLAARLAALALLRALLAEPPTAGPYLPGSHEDAQRWRRCLAGVLAPRLLAGGDEPLPADAEPPAEYLWRTESAEVAALEQSSPGHDRAAQLRSRWDGLSHFGALLSRVESDPPRYLVIAPQGGLRVVTQLPSAGVQADVSALQAWLDERLAQLPEGARLTRPLGWVITERGVLAARENVEGEPLDPEQRWEPAHAQAKVAELARGLDAAAALGLVVFGHLVWSNLRLASDGLHLVGLEEVLWWERQVFVSGDTRARPDPQRVVAFSAPESLRDSRHRGPRAVVFELAALLYWLLCGVEPFPPSRPLRAFLERRLAPDARPPSAREHRPELSLELAELLSRALSPDPGARPATPAEFAFALEATLR